jgi:hypothetical protein
MARRQEKRKQHNPKTILRFPDLEQSKNAVVNSLAAASSQESYGHAIDEFVGWYWAEPRLAFNRTVVLRYTNTPATGDLLSSLLDDAGNPIDRRRTAADGTACDIDDSGLFPERHGDSASAASAGSRHHCNFAFQLVSHRFNDILSRLGYNSTGWSPIRTLAPNGDLGSMA